ncbi:MAG: PEP-CTERM sorting domain-containing protein [Pirellulaceae bacterium]|nr:PEP-CTERM sorting domain-containing protein [Pirellulaceae bacterium]
MLIYSTDSDQISSFGYDLRITRNAANSRITILEVQTIENYVFASDAQAFAEVIDDDTIKIIGGDDNGGDTTINQTPRLLARIIVEHSSESANLGVGDEFLVTLWTEEGNVDDFSDNTTLFVDEGFAPVALSSSILPPSSGALTSGTIKIVATPEPATLVLLGTAATAYWGTRRFRRPRKAAKAIA